MATWLYVSLAMVASILWQLLLWLHGCTFPWQLWLELWLTCIVADLNCSCLVLVAWICGYLKCGCPNLHLFWFCGSSCLAMIVSVAWMVRDLNCGWLNLYCFGFVAGPVWLWLGLWLELWVISIVADLICTVLVLWQGLFGYDWFCGCLKIYSKIFSNIAVMQACSQSATS